jgi:hypothetical protein
VKKPFRTFEKAEEGMVNYITKNFGPNLHPVKRKRLPQKVEEVEEVF